MTEEPRRASSGAANRFRFGPFGVDLRSGELFRLGKRVPLQRLPFELLALLVRGQGDVVTRDDLRAGLWHARTFVDFEHGLNTAMRKLRRALGDSADEPLFVETISGRGYRLCMRAEPVERSDESLGDVAALSSTISRIARPPFIGRARELRRLETGLSLAEKRHAGVVLVVGEPGIGKTRLLEEFELVASRRGAVVLVGRCAQGESAPPHSALRQALSALARSDEAPRLFEYLPLERLAIAAKIAPALRELLPDLPDVVALGPEEERHRLHDAIAQLFVLLAERAPIVLLVDDLHWADSATLGLLSHVCHSLAGSAFLLVGAYRNVEVDRTHPLAQARTAFAPLDRFEELPLEGLGADSVRALVVAVADSSVTSDVAAGLHRATNGNPFFLREVLLQWARDERRHDDIGSSVSSLAVPDSVRSVIVQRLAKLSERAQRLLTTASAFHGTFYFDATAEAAGIDSESALDALDQALEAQLIRGAGAPDDYDFSHALIRHTLYESLTPARRVRVHRQLGAAMAAEENARASERIGQIAEQFWLSRELIGAEIGVTHCLDAVARAEAATDYAGAGRFVRMALDLLPDSDGARPRLLGHLALLLAWSGESEAAVGVGSQAAGAIARSEGADAAADYLSDASNAVWLHGWDPRAWELAALGLDYIGPRRDLTWARLSAHEVMARTARDPRLPGLERDTPLRREVFRMLLAHRHDLSFVELNELWRVQVFSSREEMLRHGSELPLGCRALLGDNRQGLAVVKPALEQVVARGQVAAAALLNVMASLCEGALGNLDAAEVACGRGLELLARAGDPGAAISLSLSLRAHNAALRGEGILETLSPLDAALPPDGPLRYLLSPHRACLTYGYALVGRTEDAHRSITEVLPAIQAAAGWSTNYTSMLDLIVRACWELELTDQAAMLERNVREKWLTPDFRGFRADPRLALALLCALQTRYDEAVDWFARARSSLDEEGKRPLRAFADFDEALMYVRRGARGDRARARPLLDAAVSRFEAIGMRGWIQRAEKLARA